jgi:hypothetical protein
MTERFAAEHLLPGMTALISEGAISSWFFMRKRPYWRLRVHLTETASDDAGGTASVDERLGALATAATVAHWTHTIYEPEVHAFGGAKAMVVAHDLFHRDSAHILTGLARSSDAAVNPDHHGHDHDRTPSQQQPSTRARRIGLSRFFRGHLRHHTGVLDGRPQAPMRDARDSGHGLGEHRREVSILLCRNLMFGAGLDWFEQGDVWARVAGLRSASLHAGTRWTVRDDLRRLLTVDANPTGPLLGPSGALAAFGPWAQAFAMCGGQLRELANTEALTRGIRAVLAHHVIFHWNRMGLDHASQSILSHTAKTVVFDPLEEAVT